MALTLNRDVLSSYMIILLVFVHASCVVSSKVQNSTAHRIFEQWMGQYGKSYKDAIEKEMRFNIFQEKLRYIEDFNGVGKHTYQLGLNEFSDLTTEEFQSRYVGEGVSLGDLNLSEARTPYHYMDVDKVLDNVNWVTKGALNSVQKQGGCGCCWAFAAAAAMEAVIKIKTGVLHKLSEQQLMDCDTISSGCKGGWAQSAYQYVVKNGGISSASSYPYKEKQESCKTAAPKVARISGWKNLPPTNETEMLKVVAQQPVSVQITVSELFGSYKSGIFNDGSCTNKLNHAVVIVGYGKTEDGTKYWLARNSWGPEWGEGGYMRIAREVPGRPQGVCGLAYIASIPF